MVGIPEKLQTWLPGLPIPAIKVRRSGDSPERRCGKTQKLTRVEMPIVRGWLVRKPTRARVPRS